MSEEHPGYKFVAPGRVVAHQAFEQTPRGPRLVVQYTDGTVLEAILIGGGKIEVNCSAQVFIDEDSKEIRIFSSAPDAN
ncbi:MAG TPA: hypothetical protein VIK01_26660 [Polyangiaceae bacterium]